MSATRDKSQRIAFVYSNLYQLYRKGKKAAHEAEVPAEDPSALKQPLGLRPGLRTSETSGSGAVLKAGVEFKRPGFEVKEHRPVELIGKRVSKRETALKRSPAPAPASDRAVQSLKDNLEALNGLHSRLRFMLKELEDLVTE